MSLELIQTISLIIYIVALLITATTFPQIEADSSIILYALIMIVVDILLVAYWQKCERIKA